mgnify:FL=1
MPCAARTVTWWAAALFYLIYAAGLVYLIVEPRLGAPLWQVFVAGAIVGLIAYGAYDLTNQATTRDWPIAVTFVDLAWGTFVSGVVATVAAGLARYFSW